MYQLVTARYKLDRRSGRWVEADLSKETIATLATNFGDVWFFITYPSLTTPKALRLSAIQNLLNGVSSTVTVQGWLTSMGNTTLPWAATVPGFTEKLVNYAQAWHVGYDIQTQGRSGVVNDQLGASYRQDLLLTHPSFTPEYINDYCLFTVNGYFHLTDWTSNGVRIIDGNTTMIKGKDNQVGVYSFEDIGKIELCPITQDMFHAMNATAPLYDGVYVTIPDQFDLTDKTVLVVVGGYLLVLSDNYERVGERTWKVEMGNIVFFDRFIQSVKNLDLSSMNIQAPDSNPSFALVDKLKGDPAVTAYMTLSQSFFVIVDAPSFFQEYEPLEFSGFPGRYLDVTGNQLPIVGAYGKQLDYHVIQEDVQFVYCTTPNQRFDYDANHRKWEQGTAIDGGRYPAKPFVEAMAYYRRLGTEG